MSIKQSFSPAFRTIVGVLVAFAVVVLCLPLASHAADCAHAKSFSDPCFAAGYQPGHPALTTPQPPAANLGKKIKGTDLMVVGKTDDGKYNVYNIEHPSPDSYFAGNTAFRDNDIWKYLPEVSKADAVNYRCTDDLGLVCVDKRGRVVGLQPGTIAFMHPTKKKH